MVQNASSSVRSDNVEKPITVYHVNPVSGDDARDGLTPNTAWKTWSPFPGKAQPGSSLLLKRGCVFSLPLPLVGGSPTAPVVYGAYGNGPKPILEGSLRNLSRPEAWSEERTGLWRATDQMPDLANVIFNDTVCGNMRYKREDLLNQGEWFQQDSNGPLFVRSTGNPANTWLKVEAIPAGYGISIDGTAHNHLRLEDLAIRKIGTHGIHIVQGATDVIINRCDLTLIGGAVFRGDEFSKSYGPQFIERRVRFGNAIEAWGNVSDVTIQGCRISEIFDGGFCIQGFDGTVAQNVRLQDNVFWNCGYDSMDIAHGVSTRQVVFERNTCANAGLGWAIQGEPWPRYSVNLPDCVGFHCNLESSFAWDSRSEVTVRNNIFFSAPKSRCFTCGVKVPGPLIVVDNNCYYQPDAADAIAQVGAKAFTSATIEEYRKQTGWDQNSIIADPLFLDPDKADFRLKPGSPCAGMGSQASLSPE
jgi:hypothetical protein